MISRIHDRLGSAGFVLAIVALVAALGGGAYAASGGLTGKQKKEVEKIAKKYAGKPGAPGAAGPAGPKGDKGDAGAAGANGTNGTNGKDGANGTNGKSVETGAATPAECKEGGATVQVAGEAATKKKVCNGSPWTADGTLPEGATETGTWQFEDNGAEFLFAPISFPIPLSSAAAATMLHESLASGASPTANCPGTAAEPEAKPGYLCIYAAPYEKSSFAGNPTGVFKIVPTAGLEEEGVTTAGAVLYFEQPYASEQKSFGSFAVTAP
jgi:hypothetical protein